MLVSKSTVDFKSANLTSSEAGNNDYEGKKKQMRYFVKFIFYYQFIFQIFKLNHAIPDFYF